MSKRLLALNLLLAAAAVVFSVRLVQVLSAPRSLPPLAVPPAAQAVVPSKDEPAPARPSLSAYGVVATKNLFNPNRSEAVAQTPLASAAKPVLHGVVINGTTRLAYIEDPVAKRVFGYKTGDTVAGGQLEQIEDDRVVIKRPEGPLEVKLKDPSKPKPVASAPAPPRVAPPLAGTVPAITPTVPGVLPSPQPGAPRVPGALRRPAPGAPAPNP